MTTIRFLAEWTLRSSILILAGAALLRALRVKDPAVRLAAWAAALCGSLAIPLLTSMAPAVHLPMPVAPEAAVSVSPSVAITNVPAPVISSYAQSVSPAFDWARAAIAYAAVAFTLLLRLCVGLAIGRRLVLHSRPGGVRNGIEFRESDAVAAPVTLGLVRPAIVLPPDWREWEPSKLDAVLAHERSHIQRHDPAMQVAAAFHRALLWHSPLSWFLHRRMVRLAEEASDDAAVVATCDRASYAEVLLEFMQRGAHPASWQGVAMARYGRPDERIYRILDETVLSRGVTRWSLAAILVLGTPLAYLVAAAHPQEAPVAPVAAAAPTAPTAPAAPAVESDSMEIAPQAPVAPEPPVAPETAPTAPMPPSPPPPMPQTSKVTSGNTIRRYMIFDNDSNSSGSWDSNDPVDDAKLRAKFGRHFAWFRQGGNEYVITDAGVLEEFRQANEPQREVNRMQSSVNAEQSRVNSLQSGVNAQQSVVNGLQGEANRRQDILNKLQSAKQDDELIRRLEAALAELKARKGAVSSQDEVNREQQKVNEMQSRVNAEQGKVNAMQSKVNEQQHRVSLEYSRRIQEIFESAIARHLAQQLM